MSKSVTEPVQKRDEAVQPQQRFKTPVRGADERAFLLSERSAAWGKREVALPPVVEPSFETGAFGPMPIEWTHDLVHCRLLSVNALMKKLPPVKVPPLYRSFLGDLQPQSAGVLRRSLTPEEVTRLDWTMDRVYLRSDIDRAVLMGIMSGCSLRKVAKITEVVAARLGGKALKKTAVSERYLYLTTIMAAEWNGEKQPVDDVTRKCWLILAEKKH
jgi:hypothetical protein